MTPTQAKTAAGPAVTVTQLRLDSIEPRGRQLRTSAAPPRGKIDVAGWTARITTGGVLLSGALLAYIVVFANPNRSENVLALLATLGFGTAFAAWTAGHWIRTAVLGRTELPSTWPITRQALLSACGVLALAIGWLNHFGSPALAGAIAIAVVASELVLRRLSVRPGSSG